MLLQTWDYLSLQCCLGPFSAGCAPVPLRGVPGALHVRPLSEWRIELSPFPFEGDGLSLEIPVRELNRTAFSDQADLERRLEEATLQHRTTAYRRMAGP